LSEREERKEKRFQRRHSRRYSNIAIITSSRGKSLQKVGDHVATVLGHYGFNTQIVYDSPSPADLVKLVREIDGAVIVMPVDTALCASFMYVYYRINASGKRAFYYGTIEGDVRNPSALDWVKHRVAFIANSNYTKSKLEQAGYRVLDVIYHGIPVEFYSDSSICGRALRESLGLTSDVFLVGYVASDHRRKGHDLASQVAGLVEKKDSSIKFIILSGSDALKYYAGLSNVVFIDKFAGIPEDQLKCIYGALDVYSHFSLAEGFGLPVLEALASGKPVIHADYNPLSEITTTNTSFRVPVRRIDYYRDFTAINFELHMYDPVEYAEVILQAKDTVKRHASELEELAKTRAREFDMYRVYYKFVELFS